MQHECDHLDGILYVDRVTDLTKLGFDSEIERFQDLVGDADEAEVEDAEDVPADAAQGAE